MTVRIIMLMAAVLALIAMTAWPALRPASVVTGPRPMTSWFAGEWTRSDGPATMPTRIGVEPGRMLLDGVATAVVTDEEGPGLLLMRSVDGGRLIRLSDSRTPSGERLARITIAGTTAGYRRSGETP